MIRGRNALFALGGALALTACTTTSFERTGYSLEGKNQNSVGCGAAVKFQANLGDGKYEKLGTIKAKEPGMGMHCNQDFVVGQFLREACALKADLVNIVAEATPDLWSSCYRATADFIRFKKRPAGLKTDARFIEATGQ